MAGNDKNVVRWEGARVWIFDFSLAAVVRWMGREDWEKDKVERALNTLGIKVERGSYPQPITIETYLSDGREEREEKWGKWADLSSEQAKRLEQAALGVPP